MPIKQIRVGHDNFSYILYTLEGTRAALVDPGYDASEALHFISSQDFKLDYVIVTHYHRDHSGECKKIKKSFSSSLVASKEDGAKLDAEVDVIISEGSQLKLGELALTFIMTPGHTPGSICILVNNEALLTGDTLFIGDCGRTDLPGGSLTQMYATLQKKILPLPDHLLVYPGHDYGDKPFDTLGNQKRTNKTLLAQSLEDLSKIP